MCGIILRIRKLSSTRQTDTGGSPRSRLLDQPTLGSDEQEWDALTKAVKDRGPDYSDALTIEGDSLELTFHATVLHLRGERVTPQPFRDEESGNVLLWNGEIFDSPHLTVEFEENDGSKLFDLIREVGFLEALTRIDGPHALIYYDRSRGKVYFTRDCLGRRSLLIKKTKEGREELVLCSAAPEGSRQGEWEEVGAEGVWELDLEKFGQEGRAEEGGPIKLHERFYESDAPVPDSFVYPFNRLNRSLPTLGSLFPMTRSFPPLPVVFPPYLDLISTFKSLLVESIRQRVLSIPFSASSSPLSADEKKPRIAVLFSGGLDCTSLALLVDEVLPEGEGIDLINVSFENPRKLRLAEEEENGAASGKGKKKRETKKERQDRIKRESQEDQGVGTREPVKVETGVDALSIDHKTELDSRTGSEDSPTTPSTSIYDVPDRLTGLESYQELCQLRSKREWNFVQVNVPYEEMLEHRQKVIDLMKPQDTVMDLSIAIAFYFAARGKGTLASKPTDPESTPVTDDEAPPYESTARVLLSGLGADELLGGYSRHRKAYNHYQSTSLSDSPPPLPDSPEGHSQWTSLIDELQMDLSRLSSRNLGRDDRIISSHSKEVRYPFLSSPVVRFLSDLEVWKKCDMRFQEGLGDKILLRLLVRDLMGGSIPGGRGGGKVWRFKKRAIHFGARTAKMELETGRAKGTDRL